MEELKFIVTVKKEKQATCSGCAFEFSNTCPNGSEDDGCGPDNIFTITEVEPYSPEEE